MYDTLLKKQDTSKVSKTHNSPNKTGLPQPLKSGIEYLSGYSMDDVRVHYNSSRPAQFHSLAYAQGLDIHVAPGQEKHLAHEAWHIVQQKEGRVQPTMQIQGVSINNDISLEHEADIMGHKADQCKVADSYPRPQRSNSLCVQMKLPTNDLDSIGVTGIKNSRDITTVSVKENGEVGDETITKDGLIFGQKRTAKQKALIAIAVLAGKIGDIVYNSTEMDKDENFYVNITAKYKSRGNWNFLIMDSRNPVKLTLTYDFRKKGINKGQTGGPGYIIRVQKSRKVSKQVISADMNNEADNKSDTEYSNIHEETENRNILDATYGLEKETPIGTNFDAYTKLAGEGARFKCVRENMHKLTDNTVFYADGETEGVAFCELWKTWSTTFGRKYNIENQELVDALLNETGKCRNTLKMINNKPTEAKKVGGDAICLT